MFLILSTSRLLIRNVHSHFAAKLEKRTRSLPAWKIAEIAKIKRSTQSCHAPPHLGRETRQILQTADTDSQTDTKQTDALEFPESVPVQDQSIAMRCDYLAIRTSPNPSATPLSGVRIHCRHVRARTRLLTSNVYPTLNFRNSMVNRRLKRHTRCMK